MDTGLGRSLEAWKCAIATVRFVPYPFIPRSRGGLTACYESVCRSAPRPRVTGCGCE